MRVHRTRNECTRLASSWEKTNARYVKPFEPDGSTLPDALALAAVGSDRCLLRAAARRIRALLRSPRLETRRQHEPWRARSAAARGARSRAHRAARRRASSRPAARKMDARLYRARRVRCALQGSAHADASDAARAERDRK